MATALTTPGITADINPAQIQRLNQQQPCAGHYVLYWMQQSQRAEYNHALAFAIQQANQLRLPLLVGFGLLPKHGVANARHFTFMLEGLQETQAALAQRGIKLVVQLGNPARVALELAKAAALLVCDRGYLRRQRQWREQVALAAPCPVYQVESDLVVPVEVASVKREWAARTFRPRHQKQLDQFLIPLKPTTIDHSSLALEVAELPLVDIAAIVRKLEIDQSVTPVSHFFKGGTEEGKRHLQRFLHEELAEYHEHRKQPEANSVSHVSKYLHFGQLSPLYIALELRKQGAKVNEQVASYLDELLIRRELTYNFVYYTPDYDKYSCLPDWVQKTLDEHRNDARPHRYTLNQLEAAQTHDPYWNAAMVEMKTTGYMHNYMRMYWGKKILEWGKTPEAAYATALTLNNKYFLDGRDPNSYGNVGWIFGLHDRSWGEREIFGKVRFLSASGLERKSDIDAYVMWVNELAAKAELSVK